MSFNPGDRIDNNSFSHIYLSPLCRIPLATAWTALQLRLHRSMQFQCCQWFFRRRRKFFRQAVFPAAPWYPRSWVPCSDATVTSHNRPGMRHWSVLLRNWHKCKGLAANFIKTPAFERPLSPILQRFGGVIMRSSFTIIVNAFSVSPERSSKSIHRGREPNIRKWSNVPWSYTIRRTTSDIYCWCR